MPPLIWLIAGEPSGDLIGARLASALTALTGGEIRITGIGGEAMARQGVVSRFPISDIAVMGVVEILPRIRLVRRRIRETVRQILEERPSVVVSIDAPGFCYRVWKGLDDAGIPLVHYVAPSVWAWNPGRAAKFAARLDHLMALLPFEPPYFEREGLPCTFVGHPVLESGAQNGDGARFRIDHRIERDATVVCVLPGSRRGEIGRLEPVFRDAARRIAKSLPNVAFVFPTISYLAGELSDRIRGWPGRAIATTGRRFDAMAASDVAMAASGTVSLELTMARVPHAISYRMNPLTVAVFRTLHGTRQRYANLVNILLGREAVPEFIQDNCRGDLIAAQTLRLLRDENARNAQLTDAEEALNLLRSEGGSPGAAAARVVTSLIGTARNQERTPG